MQQKFGLNAVKDRILILSPIVQGRLDSELKVDDFQAIEQLGQGAFGKVFKTKHKKSGAIMALKQMEKQQIKDQGMIKQIQTEVKVMYNLDHPQIIKLYNHFEEENFIYLMIEYAGGGQLYQKLKREKRFDETTVRKYMADIILAVEYLHNQDPPIIHRDIKPENLILNDQGRVKLVDFGWSNFKNVSRNTYCGTLDYLAPEMILEQGHDEKLDIWGLGVLMYEFLTGRAPFAPNISEQKVDPTRARAMLEENILKVRLEYPSDFPSLAKDLVNSFLKREPSQRKPLSEIKKNPWFILEKEGISIFETEQYKVTSATTTASVNDCGLKLLPTQINPLRLEGGFSAQFIADFANRLHQNLVKTILTSAQHTTTTMTTSSSSQKSSSAVSTQSQQKSLSNNNFQEEIETWRRRAEKQQSTVLELQKQLSDSQVLVKVREEEYTQIQASTRGEAEATTSSSQRRMQLAKEEIERLKSEKDQLDEQNNELEQQVKQMISEHRKAQDSKKDVERYKLERSAAAERIKRFQEEFEQSSAEHQESVQKKDQEISILQFKLSQYEKIKGSGSSVSGGIRDLNREVLAAFEEMKKQFVLTNKQIEINESYAIMERSLNKLKVEKKTLEEDLRAQIQEDFQEKLDEMEVQQKQRLQQLKDAYEKQVVNLNKKLETLVDAKEQEDLRSSEVESLKKELKQSAETIDNLRNEQDNNWRIKAALDKRTKESEEEILDLQQKLRASKSAAAQKK